MGFNMNKLGSLVAISLMYSWTMQIAYSQDSLYYTHSSIEFVDSKIGILDKDTTGITKGLSLGLPAVHLSSAHYQSNGPDLLSTLLVRGMASRHTAILWNGWNIQSPVNGVFDLSLISNVSHNAHLITSSGTSILGNASSAGALILSTPSMKDNHYLSLGTWQNSYGNTDLNAQLGLHAHGWSIQSSYQWTHHENNFKFDRFGVVDQLDFGAKNAIDFNTEISRQINDKQNIKAAIWYQNIKRQISPTKTAVYNNEHQDDQNLRTHLEWSFKDRNRQVFTRLGLMSEEIVFRSNSILESVGRADTYLSEAVIKDRIYGVAWAAGVQYKKVNAVISSMNSDNSVNSTESSRAQASLWMSGVRKLSHRISVDLGARVEAISDGQRIYTYHLAPSIILGKGLLSYKLNSVFQLPTLNDLYWPVGGNPELLNETGIAQELSYKSTLNSSSQVLKYKVALFSYHADNWILWRIQGFEGWQAQNVRNVWSRGIELNMNYGKTWKQDKILNSGIQLSYTRAETTKAESKLYEGKQLAYVPQYKGVWTNAFSYKNISIHMESVFVGDRFVDSANSEFVDSYGLTHLEVFYKLRLNSTELDLSVRCDNLSNKNYEIVRYYPVPLRNYTFAAQLKI